MGRKFDTEPRHIFEQLSRYVGSLRGIFNKGQYDDIHTLVFFIGYPRSGHSLVGSLLDAHPEMVIAHELDALYYFKKGYTAHQVYHLIEKNSVAFTQDGREWMGYNYQVPNQWQGKYQRIKVIGDKCGGRSSRRLKNPAHHQLIDKIKESTNCKIKFIHVIRNPFDNLTTMLRRANERNGTPISNELLETQIKQYFRLAGSNARLREAGRFEVIDIDLEDFSANPTIYLEKICDFIGIETSPAYLKDCASLVWPQAKKTRNNVDIWTPDIIEQVEKEIKKYDFLSRYHFSEE